MRTLTTITAAALLAAHSAFATPFNARVVPEDATWVVHIDVEATLASPVGEFLLEHANADWGQLEMVEEQLGIDPFDVVLGVTVFGEGEPGEEPVIVMTTTDELDDVLAAVTAMAEVQDTVLKKRTRGGVTLYEIPDELTFAVMNGDARGTRVVVAAPDGGSIRGAIAAIRDGDDALELDRGQGPQRGSLVYASMLGDLSDLGDVMGGDVGLASMFANAIHDMTVDIGVADDDVSLVLQAGIDEEQGAVLKEALEGAIAFIPLIAGQQGGDLDDVAELLEGLDVDFGDERLSLSLSVSIDTLMKLIDEYN